MEAAIFFWLAGIAEGISSTLSVVGGISFLVGLILCIVYAVNRGSTVTDWDWSPDYKSKTYTLEPDSTAIWANAMWKTRIPKMLLLASAITLPLALCIPPKQTIYLMAGGYLGQQVIQSDTAEKVMKIINQHLDEQLQKMTK
jgi:hypothetical protein